MSKIAVSAMVAAAVTLAAVATVIAVKGRAAHDREAQHAASVIPGSGHAAIAGVVSDRSPAEAANTAAVTMVVDSGGDPGCSTDGRWCVSLGEATREEGLRPPVLLSADQARKSDLAPQETSDGETSVVWPKLVSIPGGGFLAGVETRTSTSYSGGGGSATALRLYRVRQGEETSRSPVLTIPVQGSLLIRACFTEADVENRAEACHDEYGFTGHIRFEPATIGPPSFVYTTRAWAFPRGASRNEDSTTRGPLTPADLVREPDKTCSFSRRFTFDDNAGIYQADRPLPDCSAYTVP